MEPDELMAQARDALTVKRVFGEPYERDGVTLVPAAVVRGGAGGGRGEGSDGSDHSGSGSGGGFGLIAKPAGVYIIEGNQVRWQPAVDVNRIVLGGQIVLIVAALTVRSILKKRRRRR